MYTKILSENQKKSRAYDPISYKKSQKNRIYDKVDAYCFQNALPIIKDRRMITLVKDEYSEAVWWQKKTEFIFQHGGSQKRGIFWVKGNSVYDGHVLSSQNLKDRQHFEEIWLQSEVKDK